MPSVYSSDTEEAIDLVLHHIPGRCDCIPHPAVKVPDLVQGEHILQGVHAYGVFHLAKVLYPAPPIRKDGLLGWIYWGYCFSRSMSSWLMRSYS